MRTQLAVIFSLPLVLTGCTLSPTAAPSPDAGLPIQGVVHGGQQGIVGAQVYMLAANTGGYGGLGIAPTTNNLSQSLLAAPGYVTTGPGGGFSITGDYSCTPNTQVYLYSVGGNPGLSGTVNNTAAGLMAALGNCPSSGNFLSATPNIIVNEVTTIAAAYAFAGFATDATHVSSSGSASAQIGIQNAFANAANLASLSTGEALATTPGVNSIGIVPQSEIYALADILASCVNTSGPTGPTNPTACDKLLNTATSDGTLSGAVPGDTATAAINISHNPGVNVSTLFALIPATGAAFATTFTQPNDFTLGIQFSGGGLNDPYAVAIDGSGNAWAANNGNTSVTELTSTGVPLSPSNGFTATSLSGVFAIAIDPSGNAWVPDFYGNSVTEISGTPPGSGTILSGTNGDTASSLSDPYAIAIDGSGNPWITNYFGTHGVTEWVNSTTSHSYTDTMSQPVSIAIDGTSNVWIADKNNSNVVEFSKTGTLLSSPKYSGGGLNTPYAIAIDHGGNAWIANQGGIETSNISELSPTGSVKSPSSGYTVGGVNSPYAIAIDGVGNVWAANNGNSSVSELSNSGAAISPSTGYTGGLVDSPDAIAVDGSGDVWIANPYDSNLNELIGVAAPVVTPLSTGVKNNTLGTRP